MAPSDNSSSEADLRTATVPSEPVSQAVTMVFTDLEGSTSLKEEMGDDRASSLIERHCGLVLQFCAAEQGRWSFDARQHPGLRMNQLSAGWLWLLRFQIALPYVYGGIAKLTPDWLQHRPAFSFHLLLSIQPS